MKNVLRVGSRSVVLAVALMSLPAWATQAKQLPAPVPPEMASAKSVFISNAGGLCDPYDPVSFGGGPNRAYREFNAELRNGVGIASPRLPRTPISISSYASLAAPPLTVPKQPRLKANPSKHNYT